MRRGTAGPLGGWDGFARVERDGLLTYAYAEAKMGDAVNLAQLEYFVRSFDKRSFSSAAESLNVTQQAVSRAVLNLERELGVRLFERGPVGLEPTTAGVRARRRAAAIVTEAAALLLEARGGTGSGRTLRLWVAETVMGRRNGTPLSDVLAYEGLCPGSHVEVVEATSDASLAAVESGEADIAVVAGRADFMRYSCRRLRSDEAHLFVGLAHRLASRTGSVSLESLRGETFLIPRGASGSIDEVCEAFYASGTDAPVAERFVLPDCSPALFMEHVYRGEGVAIMAGVNLPLVDLSQARILDVRPNPFTLGLNVVARKAIAHDAELLGFRDFLVGVFTRPEGAKTEGASSA